MQKFIIGTENFGIEKVTYKIDKENSIINDLTITGNEQLFEKLSENEEGEWSWALYPPKLYLRVVPFKAINEKIEIIITEEILDECDVALYLMRHYDIKGVLTIDNNDICSFKGITYISGKEMQLEFEVDLKS